jgi:hypothetical protein
MRPGGHQPCSAWLALQSAPKGQSARRAGRGPQREMRTPEYNGWSGGRGLQGGGRASMSF